MQIVDKIIGEAVSGAHRQGADRALLSVGEHTDKGELGAIDLRQVPGAAAEEFLVRGQPGRGEQRAQRLSAVLAPVDLRFQCGIGFTQRLGALLHASFQLLVRLLRARVRLQPLLDAGAQNQAGDGHGAHETL